MGTNKEENQESSEAKCTPGREMPAGGIFAESKFALLDKSAEKPVHHTPQRKQRNPTATAKRYIKANFWTLRIPIMLVSESANIPPAFDKGAANWKRQPDRLSVTLFP